MHTIAQTCLALVATATIAVSVAATLATSTNRGGAFLDISYAKGSKRLRSKTRGPKSHRWDCEDLSEPNGRLPTTETIVCKMYGPL